MRSGLLRVVQLNLGSLFEPGWAERRHEVVAWIDRLEPDIVCLQEAWENPSTPNTAGWVAEHAQGPWHHVFGGGCFAPELWPEPDLRFGSAVLSRWPIDDHALHLLPTVGDVPQVQGTPWELLRVATAGLDVFSTHLAAAPSWGLDRAAQVLAIDDHVRAVRGDRDEVVLGQRRAGMPPILCGDFNAEPDSDEIRFLCGFTALEGRTTFWQDAWRTVGDGPGFTQDWHVTRLARALNVHRKRIDYVFVGDPFLREGHAGRIETAALAFHEPLTGVHASDHVGLVVDITWPDRP